LKVNLEDNSPDLDQKEEKIRQEKSLKPENSIKEECMSGNLNF